MSIVPNAVPVPPKAVAPKVKEEAKVEVSSDENPMPVLDMNNLDDKLEIKKKEIVPEKSREEKVQEGVGLSTSQMYARQEAEEKKESVPP